MRATLDRKSRKAVLANFLRTAAGETCADIGEDELLAA